jgi:hypothetical protein
MKKLVVNFRDGNYLNIEADRLAVCKNDENVILAYKGDSLVAAVDMSSALSLYLSEAKRND